MSPLLDLARATLHYHDERFEQAGELFQTLTATAAAILPKWGSGEVGKWGSGDGTNVPRDRCSGGAYVSRPPASVCRTTMKKRTGMRGSSPGRRGSGRFETCCPPPLPPLPTCTVAAERWRDGGRNRSTPMNAGGFDTSCAPSTTHCVYYISPTNKRLQSL